MDVQRSNGLAVDGKAGPKTLKTLGMKFNSNSDLNEKEKSVIGSMIEFIMQLIAKFLKRK